MAKYASNTSVSSARSRGEIEATLARYGANAFSYGWEDREGETLAMVAFQIAGRRIRFLVPMPSRDGFRLTPSRGYERRPSDVEKFHEQACRQRWRALLLLVKAKLEAVESEISTVEEEFLAHTLLPNGRTVAEITMRQIEHAYSTGAMPESLLSLPPAPEEILDAEVVE